MTTALVIDNDSAIRQLLTMALEQGGVRVLTAASAKAADKILRHQNADVLLVDLNLGGGESGASMVDSWSAKGMLRPFIVVTGTPDHPSLKAMKDYSEFRGVVAKPFQVLDLVKQVKKIS